MTNNSVAFVDTGYMTTEHIKAFSSLPDVTSLVARNVEALGLAIAKLEFSSGDVSRYYGIRHDPGRWAVSKSRPAKNIEMRPFKPTSVQPRDTRAQVPPELSEDDRTYRPGLHHQAEQALAALRGEPVNLADFDDPLQSMKLVADFLGIAR